MDVATVGLLTDSQLREIGLASMGEIVDLLAVQKQKVLQLPTCEQNLQMYLRKLTVLFQFHRPLTVFGLAVACPLFVTHALV